MLVSCLPDTGCSQTVVSADTATLLKLHVNKQTSIDLFNANGGRVPIEGTANMSIGYQNTTIASTVIVAAGMAHAVLLSWHDMIRLHLIPQNFPCFTNNVHTKDLRQQVVVRKSFVIP